ncbi:MAG TPA: hypothetical protein VFJ74_10425 [Gemmatimonadaceae bacterium]|nr:hypothetical protein [Gemmatimonadaceae bacterium]
MRGFSHLPTPMNFRLVRPAAVALLALVPALACSDSSTGPNGAKVATQAADNFDHVADSLTNAGNPDDASVYQSLADLIRAVGRADQVVVKVDGRSVTHTTLAFETLVPASACANSTDPVLCREFNPAFTQVVLGWTGTNLKESFVAYSEQTGSASVSDAGSGPYPPAYVYYSIRDVYGPDTDLFGATSSTWYSAEGTVTMQPGARSGNCTVPAGSEPGITFTCFKASFSPAFDVTALDYASTTTPTSKHITMASQRVDGLSADVTQVYDDGSSTLGVARPSVVRRDAALTTRALLRRVAPALVHVPAAAR